MNVKTDDVAENPYSSTEPENPVSKYRPLRVWPAALLVIGMVVARFVPGWFQEGPQQIWMVAAFGPLLLGILMCGWWLLLSRATWTERVIGLLGIVAIGGVVIALLHPTMVGPPTTVMTIPFGMAIFGVAAILVSRMLSFKRTILLLLATLFGFGFSLCLRGEGMWGDFEPLFSWRWEPSTEENLLAKARSDGTTTDLAPAKGESEEAIVAALESPEWPNFRGANYDSRVTGANYSDDWSSNPPELLWTIPVGPAWSSFSLAGNFLFTGEQRGEEEMVFCYNAETGTEIWRSGVKERFVDNIAGTGPRATPTIHGRHLYTFGASGILLKLNATTGEIVWKKDARIIAERQPPMWGFSSSPLVVGKVVVVHAGGSGDKGLLAFDLESGELVWSAPDGNHSYSSPQLCRIDGRDYILGLSNDGLNMIDPVTGELVVEYSWPYQGYRSLQPCLLGDTTIVLPTGAGLGSRRVELSVADGQISFEEVWTSKSLKSDFNDFVVFEDHAYGFDGTIFTCVDLETGERKWKAGRYGKGQVLLLADSGLLLVASEKGEAILLGADPEKHDERGKIKALKGKTWNHPVVVGDRLYIRNAKEAACFRLPLE